MPYTLMKALSWLVLALVIGFSVGWLLRSLVAHRQVARARSQRVDAAEVDRLRGRVANLESVVAERDRLAAELATARAGTTGPATTAADSPSDGSTSDGSTARTSGAIPTPADVTTETANGSDPATTTVGSARSAAPVGSRRTTTDAPADERRAAPPTGGGDATEPAPPPPPDTAAATEVLGRRIELDDLKAIEGIGPKIEELCHGIGIRTWFDLATTEVSLLRTMLTDAGARYKMHDPTTWPRQAELLAHGRWAEFAELSSELDRGKAARS